MEEKELNEKESIELISRMIKNSQNRLEGDEGIPFLAWGYATVITTIAVALLLHFTQNYYWNFLWFAIPAIGWPLTAISNKKSEIKKGVTTYVDKTVGYIWLVLGIAGAVASVLCLFHFRIGNILMIVTLLMSSGVTITGFVIDFKPLKVCGFIGMGIALIFNLLPNCVIPEYLMLTSYSLFALAFIVMMIIPGHILNCKSKKEVRNV